MSAIARMPLPTSDACHYTCHHDLDTGELFCPVRHGWVEACPLLRREDDDENVETENESEEDDEEL